MAWCSRAPGSAPCNPVAAEHSETESPGGSPQSPEEEAERGNPAGIPGQRPCWSQVPGGREEAAWSDGQRLRDLRGDSRAGGSRRGKSQDQ